MAIITRETSIGGHRTTMQADGARVSTRTEFADAVEARGFADGLRARGFEPRELRESEVLVLVVLNTTAADVLRLLA
jgi:hypothetical protein